MAVRSGAGTGVIVSLVVFIIMTICLLVLTIVFYASKQKQAELLSESENARDVYVTAQQRNRDDFQRYEAAAGQNRQSVAMYLHTQLQEATRYLGGDPSASLADVKTNLADFGIEADAVVANEVQDMTRQLNSRENEVDNLQRRVSDLQDELAEKDTQLAEAAKSHEEEIRGVQAEIAAYRLAAQEYRDELDRVVADINASKERIEDEYDSRLRDLQAENDELSQKLVVQGGRVDELESILSKDRLRAQNPAMLVDGHVIDAGGTDDQVFIDRGKVHRIPLGMRFEVYDSPAAIRINPQTGEIFAGKATIQVTKVNDTTSTAKVIRGSRGRPVVSNNIIANAVYDPQYRFKFLVHGRFDTDGDGIPTEAEADYLREQVTVWGGVSVERETIPADLDFLVIGDPPPPPGPLPPNPTETQIDEHITKRQVKQLYDDLFEQASEAQIPVLNANRFMILTGMHAR